MKKPPIVGGQEPNPRPNPFRHPVDTGRYILVTSMIEQLEAKVSQWVELRVTGALVVGDPRLGKSTARKFLEASLAERFEGLSMFSLLCRDSKTISEDAFFEHILTCAKHAEPAKGKAPAKRQRLTEHLIALGERSGRKHVLMFADDAQRLTEQHFKWLMDIHNELKEAGIDLTIILFGQKELLHIRTSFQETGKKHILGRFMMHDFMFNGLIDEASMAYSLRSYDVACEYPPNSGCSFSRHYFPAAFDAGWRLESIAPDLWRAFMEITVEHAVSKYAEVPMQYFSRTVDSILKNVGPRTEVVPRISVKELEQLILGAGYGDFRKNGDTNAIEQN